MTNTVLLKRSSVANDVPTDGQLQYGELALNYTDGNLFYKSSSNVITTIASNKFVSVTGNITGNNVIANSFIGDGSQLTNINAFTTISVPLQGNIYSNASSTLTFEGTGITISTNPLTGTVSFVNDNNSSLSIFATGGTMGTVVDPVSASEDLGLISSIVGQIYDLGDFFVNGLVINQSIVNYTITGNKLANDIAINTSGPITSSANISGQYILGNGAFLTGLPGGYSNVDVSNYLSSGTNTANIITIGNIVGNNLTGTLTISAQPNITSVGTLSSLSVTGNTTSGNFIGTLFSANVVTSNDLYVGDTLYEYATTTTTATAQVALTSFAAVSFGGGEFLIQATQGTTRHITKILVVHNGTIANATEYAVIKTGSSLFTTEVDISGGNVRILVTPASTTSTVFKTSYTLIGA